MTQTLESEETPPPMPSSWRPLGSGAPIAARKMGPQASRSRGRSSARSISAFEVPPRMKTARNRACRIALSSGSRRAEDSRFQAASGTAVRRRSAQMSQPTKSVTASTPASVIQLHS